MTPARSSRTAPTLAVALFSAALLVIAAPAFAATDTIVPPKPEAVLIVRSYKTQPPNLTVGARFKLELLIDNVVNVDAGNVVVTVGTSAAASAATAATSSPSGQTPDVVVLGSNVRYLGAIAGSATGRSITFDLLSGPRSLPGPYSLPVTIQFDSTNGGRITSVQSVGLAFTRALVFDVGALSYPRSATVGQPFHVAVSVRNTNAFPINGVSVSFEATNATWVSSNETTVGVLEPGKEGSFDATGIPQVAGQMAMTLSITYKDDYNQTKQIRRDFAFPVSPKPPSQTAALENSPSLLLLLVIKALIGIGG